MMCLCQESDDSARLRNRLTLLWLVFEPELPTGYEIIRSCGNDAVDYFHTSQATVERHARFMVLYRWLGAVKCWVDVGWVTQYEVILRTNRYLSQ
jgi:hypothetical protein